MLHEVAPSGRTLDAMRGPAVLEAIEWFAERGVDVWIAGGWGVDALIGCQHRRHDDLDICVRAEDLDGVVGMLSGHGFVVAADLLPTRVVLRHPERGDVDVHPIRFEADGSAWLPGPDGARFDYPATSFVRGTIEGVAVPCIDAALQCTFHLGYVPGAKDRADMQALAEVGLIDLPDAYRG
jgi:lincosamide nucleotidyltransferase A/C/D/E